MTDIVAYGLMFIVANYAITKVLDAVIARISNVSLIVQWKTNIQRYNEYYKDK